MCGLHRVLRGRITFTPTEAFTEIPAPGFKVQQAGYTFEAPSRFDKLVTGIVVERPAWIKDGDRRGTEHLTPEDTFDGDYGRLLERAEGMASPRGVTRTYIEGPLALAT